MESAQRIELIEGIRAAIEKQNAPFVGRLAALEQHVATGNGRPQLAGGAGRRDPFGTDEFRARMAMLTDGHTNTGHVKLNIRPKHLRALISGPGNDSPNDTFTPAANRGPITGPAQRPLTLLDLLPSRPVTSNAFEHVRLSRSRSAAVQQGEGALKSETVIETALVTSKIATIATHTTASKQVLSDAAGLDQALRTVLALDVADEAERLLINGNGTTDAIEGLLTLATPFAPTASAFLFDSISEGIAIQESAGYRVSMIVMHPFDWHEGRIARASGSGGYLAGSWSDVLQPSVWTVPVVTTASMPLGTALLVDTSRVQLLDREQTTVLVSTEHADNFTKNLVTILAEVRLGLAVYDSAAIASVSLGSP